MGVKSLININYISITITIINVIVFQLDRFFLYFVCFLTTR